MTSPVLQTLPVDIEALHKVYEKRNEFQKPQSLLYFYRLGTSSCNSLKLLWWLLSHYPSLTVLRYHYYRFCLSFLTSPLGPLLRLGLSASGVDCFLNRSVLVVRITGKYTLRLLIITCVTIFIITNYLLVILDRLVGWSYLSLSISFKSTKQIPLERGY